MLVCAVFAPDLTLQSEVVPCCDLAKRGPVAAVARLLPQRRKATIATSGENAAGKSQHAKEAVRLYVHVYT